jgi:hypothetical protein
MPIVGDIHDFKNRTFEISEILLEDYPFLENWFKASHALKLGTEYINDLTALRNKNEPIAAIVLRMLNKWTPANPDAAVLEFTEILSKNLGSKKSADDIKALFAGIQQDSSIPEPQQIVVSKPATLAVPVKLIVVPHNQTGWSYEKLFGDYLTVDVKNVTLRDPYIRNPSQLNDLDHFINLLLTKCIALETLRLETSFDSTNGEKAEKKRLAQFKALADKTLQFHGRGNGKFIFIVSYNNILHDRALILDNGMYCSLGKGLDYFYPCGESDEGWKDLDKRHCQETNVIWYKSSQVNN